MCGARIQGIGKMRKRAPRFLAPRIEMRSIRPCLLSGSNQLPACALVFVRPDSGWFAFRSTPRRLSLFPCVTDAFLQLDLPGLHERGIALLSDLHRSVAKQKRDLIDRDARKQHLDREGVAEHVPVAALDLAVRRPDINQLEQAAIAS